MTWSEVGGLWVSDLLTLTSPLVRLTASSQSLEFGVRFGIGRFIGPWTVAAGDVALVRPSAFWRASGVEIQQGSGKVLVFFASGKPQSYLLARFEEFGYATEH